MNLYLLVIHRNYVHLNLGFVDGKKKKLRNMNTVWRSQRDVQVRRACESSLTTGVVNTLGDMILFADLHMIPSKTVTSWIIFTIHQWTIFKKIDSQFELLITPFSLWRKYEEVIWIALRFHHFDDFVFYRFYLRTIQGYRSDMCTTLHTMQKHKTQG